MITRRTKISLALIAVQIVQIVKLFEKIRRFVSDAIKEVFCSLKIRLAYNHVLLTLLLSMEFAKNVQRMSLLVR